MNTDLLKKNKKLLFFVIIFITLLVVVFAYNYFTEPKVNAPTMDENQEVSNNNFQGPTSAPSMKGPGGPPPSN